MSEEIVPPTCGGRPMDYNVLTRMWECACGRYVTDDFLSDAAVKVTSFAHVATRVRPARVSDFVVWLSMRQRDRALASMPPERHAEMCDGLMFGPSPDPDDPRTVSCSEDYCRGARRRIDEWLIASMEKLMRDCEIAGTPFDKHRLFRFSAGTGTGATPGPEHGHAFTFADYSAARSRVLAVKVAASDAARAEAARRVVLGPIDDESEA